MGWFSKKDKSPIINEPKDMSPLEAVTHLCTSILLADGHADHEEREVWLVAIEELFPEFSEERADRYSVEAQTSLNSKSGDNRTKHIKDVLKRIQTLLSSEQVSKLSNKIADLIEADGIIMTSEMDIARLIEQELGIKIDLDENL
ncbi:MAG: hypothetical protein ACJZ2B_03110 [Candidatus Neomarinimicrobiota bacterium]|tara:strand:- start:3051 stop:3485 length:435 start_codon:yes stop_codon:yes gene_type:complete